MLLCRERLLSLPLCLILGLANATCYFPNGNSDQDHSPCNPKADVSVCCSFGFECLSNGLCNDIRYENYTRVLRGGCTDKGWSEGCGKVCLDIWPQGDELVTYCGNGNYCCNRPDGKSCCDQSTSLHALGKPTVIATAKTITHTEESTTVNTTPTTAATSPTITPPRSTSDSDPESNVKAIYKAAKNTVAIGVGVGVAVGVLLFLGLFVAWFVIQRRKRRRRQHDGVRGLMDRDVGRETINPFANAGVGDDHPQQSHGAQASGAVDNVRKSMGDTATGNRKRGEMADTEVIELAVEKIHELPTERDPREVDGTTRRLTKVEEAATWQYT